VLISWQPLLKAVFERGSTLSGPLPPPSSQALLRTASWLYADRARPGKQPVGNFNLQLAKKRKSLASLLGLERNAHRSTALRPDEDLTQFLYGLGQP
jgi:hypothetical protein